MDATTITDGEVFAVFAIGGLIALMFFIVAILFLRSLDKAVLSVRTENPMTHVSRAWVWTQLIPIWNFVAMIVYHVKMTSAATAFNFDKQLPPSQVAYPVVIGWFYVFGFLYSWVPLLGALAMLVFWIIFWVQISGFSSAATLAGRNTTQSTTAPL